jgi:hypothetical protein
MKEAKRRNPSIKLFGLSWGAPGWIGNGSYFSQDNIAYHLKWLQGAQRVHGLSVDYIGIWNEHSASTDWIVRLRRAMDGAGFAHTAIVATDQGGWPLRRDGEKSDRPRCRVSDRLALPRAGDIHGGGQEVPAGQAHARDLPGPERAAQQIAV